MEGEYHSILSGMYEWACQAILIHKLISHRGYFTHRDQRYQIKPLQSTDEGEHAVLPYSWKGQDTVHDKDAEKQVVRKRSHLRTSRSLKNPNASTALFSNYVF
jgi:ADAM-like decysin 1